MRQALWFALGLSIVACNDDTLLHSYKPLPVEGWNRCDTISFNLPKTEKNINGTLTIGLRTKANIGIRDVVLAVEQCNENAYVCRCDTLQYPLTDSEGYALSKGVNCHQYETMQLPIHIQEGQNGSIRIHHLMTNEVLTGITEVGIKINKR